MSAQTIASPQESQLKPLSTVLHCKLTKLQKLQLQALLSVIISKQKWSVVSVDLFPPQHLAGFIHGRADQLCILPPALYDS